MGHAAYVSAVEYAWRQAARHWVQDKDLDPRLERSCLDVLDWLPYFIQGGEITEDGRTFICVPTLELCRLSGIHTQHTVIKVMRLFSEPDGPLELIKDWPKGTRCGKCYAFKILTNEDGSTTAISPELMKSEGIRNLCKKPKTIAAVGDVENSPTTATDGSTTATDGSTTATDGLSTARTQGTNADSISISISIEEKQQIESDVRLYASMGWKGCKRASLNEIKATRKHAESEGFDSLSDAEKFLIVCAGRTRGHYPPSGYTVATPDPKPLEPVPAVDSHEHAHVAEVPAKAEPLEAAS